MTRTSVVLVAIPSLDVVVSILGDDETQETATKFRAHRSSAQAQTAAYVPSDSLLFSLLRVLLMESTSQMLFMLLIWCCC